MSYESRQKLARNMVTEPGPPRPRTAKTVHRGMESKRGKKLVLPSAPPSTLAASLSRLKITVAGENFTRIHDAPTAFQAHRQQFLIHDFGNNTVTYLIVQARRMVSIALLDVIVHQARRPQGLNRNQMWACVLFTAVIILAQTRSAAPHTPPAGPTR